MIKSFISNKLGFKVKVNYNLDKRWIVDVTRDGQDVRMHTADTVALLAEASKVFENDVFYTNCKLAA